MVTFQPMHNLHTESRNWFVGYVNSKAICTREGGSVIVGRIFVSLKDGILCMSNLLHRFMKKGFPVTPLRIEVAID